MSQENIEIVKAIFQGWDDAGVEGMLPFFHEEIEYVPMEEGATVQGLDELLRYFERWMESWETFSSIPTEFLAEADYVVNGCGDESAWTWKRRRGRNGVLAGVALRDGKVARWEEYLDRQEALEAAGLSEPRRSRRLLSWKNHAPNWSGYLLRGASSPV